MPSAHAHRGIITSTWEFDYIKINVYKNSIAGLHIHNLDANSHLIEVSMGHVASIGVLSFTICEYTPFG